MERREVGRVLGPRGLRGELKIQLDRSDSTESVQERVILARDREERSFEVRRIVATDPRTVVVSLEGIADRTAAEAWQGARVLVEASAAERPIDRLVGARVVDDASGAELGAVAAIADNGAQALLVIEREGREVMVPLVDELVPAIEEDGASIVVRVRPIPGLFEE